MALDKNDIAKRIAKEVHNEKVKSYDKGFEAGKDWAIEQIKERLDKAIDFPQLDRKRTDGVYIYQELIKVKLFEMFK
jgi:hypothetical protein